MEEGPLKASKAPVMLDPCTSCQGLRPRSLLRAIHISRERRLRLCATGTDRCSFTVAVVKRDAGLNSQQRSSVRCSTRRGTATSATAEYAPTSVTSLERLLPRDYVLRAGQQEAA